MISESWSWKRQIARRAEALRRRKVQKRWSNESFAGVEQDIFLAAYAVRKLIEAYKVSDELDSSSLTVTTHPHCGLPVDLMNNHRIIDLYDMSAMDEATVSLRAFCNQIIHSFVFVPVLAENGGLCGFFVASDWEKDNRLFYFEIDAVIGMLSRVVADDIVTLRLQRAGIGEPCRIVRKSCKPEVA
jgi:hypothetical protein